MDLTSAAGSARPQDQLAPGTQLGGGRYTLGAAVRTGLFGHLYEATDATTGNPVSIHLLDERLAQQREILSALRDDARRATRLSHKNIAQVIEFGVEGPHTYLATELVEGHCLRELLERKRQTGTVGFGAKGALNIIGHVSAALEAAGANPHGALSLDGVAVSRAGRVRVSDFGLAAAVPAVARLGRQVSSFAPEILAGGRPSAAADVYGMGAVFYEILVGAPPVKGCTRPSEAVPGIPAAIDAVIGRSMLPAPEKRFAGVDELRAAVNTAMAEVAQQASPQPAQSSGSFTASQSGRISAQVPAQPASLAESIAGARMSGQMMAAVSALPTAAAPSVVSLAQPSPALAAAMASTEERWLISKGKLDYGPFTLAQIAEQVQTDQILPGHVIIDNHSGSRTKVEDQPLLFELVEAAKQKRDERRRAQAEVHHAATEKRRGATLYLFIGVGVLALGAGVYVLVDKLSASKKDDDTGAIEGLEGGALQAKISFPTKEERRARARSRGGSKGKSGAGGPAGGWDDSLNLDMSDDESEDGGSDRLSDSDVNPVIQKHGGGFSRCLSSTGTSGANIEFIVKPDGRVSHVRVNGKTDGGLANCLRGVMQRMQFPTFNGTRSKHYFDVGY